MTKILLALPVALFAGLLSSSLLAAEPEQTSADVEMSEESTPTASASESAAEQHYPNHPAMQSDHRERMQQMLSERRAQTQQRYAGPEGRRAWLDQMRSVQRWRFNPWQESRNRYLDSMKEAYRNRYAAPPQAATGRAVPYHAFPSFPAMPSYPMGPNYGSTGR